MVRDPDRDARAISRAITRLFVLTRWLVGKKVRLWLHGRRAAWRTVCSRLLCLLEDLDADAAARRVLERLFVLDGEVVLLETVKRGTESGEVRKQVCPRGALTRRQTLER